jgi:hypothetical protein
MYRRIPFDDGVSITTLCADNGALFIGCSNGDVLREPHVAHYLTPEENTHTTDIVCTYVQPVQRIIRQGRDCVSCTFQSLAVHTPRFDRLDLASVHNYSLIDVTALDADVLAWCDSDGGVHVQSKYSHRSKIHPGLRCTALHSQANSMLVLGHSDGRATVHTVCTNFDMCQVLQVQADNDAPIAQVHMISAMEFVTCARNAHSPVWWRRLSVHDRSTATLVRLEGHWQPVTSIASHAAPLGAPLVATASADSTVRVWQQGVCVYTVCIDIAQQVTAVVFLQPTMLAFGTSDGNVYVQSFLIDDSVDAKRMRVAQDVCDKLGVVINDRCLALVLATR